MLWYTILKKKNFSIIITIFSYNLGVGRLCGNNTGQHMYIGEFASSSIPAVAVILKVKELTHFFHI